MSLAILACAWSRPALALELGSQDDLLSVEIHGFVSQGFILTSANDYLADGTTSGSFQFTEVGLNFTKSLTDRLRIGLQFFAEDIGPTGNYTPTLDWAYLDYRFADWFGIRVGRVKLPFGLYNEVQDADSARLPILLPQSVYPLTNSNYLLAETGAELYGYQRLGGAGALDYRLYGGTIFINPSAAEVAPGSPIVLQGINVPYLVGGRLLWETPLNGLRAALSVQALRLDLTLLAGDAVVTDAVPAALWVASLEYATHGLVLTAEYSRWYVRSYSSNTAVFPDIVPSLVSERAYGMASYRATRWFQAGAYYSLLFPNTEAEGGLSAVQNDLAGILRFDVNANWLIKLEGHYMIGTAGLDSTLNGNEPLSALDAHWAVLLLKTTAYF